MTSGRQRGFMLVQIDKVENAYHIYMLLNKPYALSFLSWAEPHLSQKEFSEILADGWIRSENPNMDKNFVKKKLVDMFKKADRSTLCRLCLCRCYRRNYKAELCNRPFQSGTERTWIKACTLS